MTLTEIHERASLTSAVMDYAQRQKTTYKTAELTAKTLGVGSKSSLYDLINGNWVKVGADLFDRIAAQCTTQTAWRIVETANYAKIRGAINKAATNGDFNALVGDTGTGKTTAAKQLTAKMENVFYIMGDVTMTKGGFLNAILSQLTANAHEYRSTKAQTDAICRCLIRAEKPVILIDDAGKLRETSLALLQVIYDRTKGNAGIVLLGTEGLWQKIAKHADTNRFFMRELNARITWGVLDYVSEADVKTICIENGISDTSAQTWLYNATFALHTLVNVIAAAKKIAATLNVPIDDFFLAKTNKDTLWFKPTSRNFRDRLKC